MEVLEYFKLTRGVKMVIKGKYENKDGKIEEIPIRKEILGQGRMTRKEYMERRNLIS